MTPPSGPARSDERRGPPPRGLIGLGAAALVVAILYFARDVFLPLALATFFAFLLSPVVSRLERLRLGRAPSAVIAMALGLSVLGAIGWAVASEGAEVVAALPEYRHNLLAKARSLRQAMPSAFRSASETVEDISAELAREEQQDAEVARVGEPNVAAGAAAPAEAEPASGAAAGAPPDRPAEPAPAEPVRVEVVAPPGAMLTQIGGYIGTVAHPVIVLLLSVVFSLFFLIYREDLRDRLIRIGGRANIQVTTTALADAGRRLMHYLVAQSIANGLNGLATGVGLYLLGIPNAALWGLLSGVLRFVPILGPWISAVFPIALAVAIFEGWTAPLLVAAYILLIDQLSVNLLEPWLYGTRIGASPIAVLFAFVFFTWLWGGIGLFLAMPIVVCLVVLGRHVPAFEVFYVLFGDEPALEPKIRLYQRLLARDRREAVRVVDRYETQQEQAGAADPTVAAYDDVIIPALALLEYDRRLGVVDDARMTLTCDILDDLLARDTTDAPAPPGKPDRPAVLLVPNRDCLDVAITRAACELLAESGTPCETAAPETLAAEISQRVGQERHPAVLLIAIEPPNIRRLLLIAKRVRADHPRTPVLVLMASRSRRGERYARRLRHTPEVTYCATLAEAFAQLAPFGRPAADEPDKPTRRRFVRPDRPEPAAGLKPVAAGRGA